MQHRKITFTINDTAEGEMLMALLAGAGYDGFEEKENELLAYIDDKQYSEDELRELLPAGIGSFTTEVVPAQNWNALWESNFEPVIVQDFCTIRAHFHDITITTPYVINITPKMSFGTGHHATTQQVMMLMKDVSFTGASVLDFGTGTGVLAILAEMLGAQHVLAIDNDEWSVENARENVQQNNCRNIVVEQGSLENAPGGATYDIILANINRNILLQYMNMLYARLNAGGMILMSGLLVEDRDTMLAAAAQAGFTHRKDTELNNWIALFFEKR